MKVNIEDIKFKQFLYPRDGLDNETVNSYRLNIDSLPPIVVTKDLVLIDGYHRLVAYKIEGRKEVEVEVVDLESDRDVFIEAVKRNALHGKALTMHEKRRLTRQLFTKIDETDIRLTLEEIASLLGVGYRTVCAWTEDIRKQQVDERNQKIFNLWLACCTHEEIAEAINNELNRPRITQIINNVKNSILAKINTPETLQIYNVWNFSKCDPRYGLDYPGRIPGQIVENVLYYYTEPFDIVVDPMAGGGTTIDVCKAMYRRYQAYDINPIREDIQKHDIKQGFPKRAKNCHLIFLDPPYWRLQKGKYSEKSVSEMSYKNWVMFMLKLAQDSYQTVQQNGYVALLVEAFLDETDTEKFLDLPFICTRMFEDIGFTEAHRISVPITSQVKSELDVARYKKKKILLDLNRDLIIFRKE